MESEASQNHVFEASQRCLISMTSWTSKTQFRSRHPLKINNFDALLTIKRAISLETSFKNRRTSLQNSNEKPVFAWDPSKTRRMSTALKESPPKCDAVLTGHIQNASNRFWLPPWVFVRPFAASRCVPARWLTHMWFTVRNYDSTDWQRFDWLALASTILTFAFIQKKRIIPLVVSFREARAHRGATLARNVYVDLWYQDYQWSRHVPCQQELQFQVRSVPVYYHSSFDCKFWDLGAGGCLAGSRRHTRR